MSETTSQPNRTHKDSLFVDYFSRDRDWRRHFLSLYNALHGTSLQVESTVLERVNIDQVLYKSFYNDIAVLVDGRFILMIEHQSTINPNMPLRLLEYITRIYGNTVDSKAKFSRYLVPLAKPEFIVFYTGSDNLPPESYLYLSDAFPNQPPNSDLTLELKVKVCTIRSGGETAQSLLARPHLRKLPQGRFSENSTSGVLRGRQPLSGAGEGGGLRGRKPPLPSRGVSSP